MTRFDLRNAMKHLGAMEIIMNMSDHMDELEEEFRKLTPDEQKDFLRDANRIFTRGADAFKDLLIRIVGEDTKQKSE